MMITTANFTDRKGAIDMVSYYCECTDNLSQIKKMLVDGGYTGQNFADRIKEITGAKVEVVKRNQKGINPRIVSKKCTQKELLRVYIV